MALMRRIFISYTHADEVHQRELSKHLRPVLLLEKIESWTDAQILPGQHIQRAIAESFHAADIILLLISVDYLASESCQAEMEIAFKREKQDKQ